MNHVPDHYDLVQFLASQGRLSLDEAELVVTEVLNYFDESVESYICRRHLALRREGFSNQHIYRVLVEEVSQRPFQAAQLSERKVRRIIYG